MLVIHLILLIQVLNHNADSSECCNRLFDFNQQKTGFGLVWYLILKFEIIDLEFEIIDLEFEIMDFEIMISKSRWF